ncbi:uncharacterized protein DS421_2g36230 [Arachis hypogaea]|nr:uncharacterized protein DS421_2g36230 [Arachis hypogaea]
MRHQPPFFFLSFIDAGIGVACAVIAFTLGKIVEVMGVNELETDETELGHIVELDLVYHSLNSSMLGVVVVRYIYI